MILELYRGVVIIIHETGRLPLAYMIHQLCRGVYHTRQVGYIRIWWRDSSIISWCHDLPHETGRLPLDRGIRDSSINRGVIIIPHETGRLPPDLVVYVIPQYGVVSHHMRESKEVWLNFNLRYTSHQHALVYPLYTIYNNSVSALHNLQQ